MGKGVCTSTCKEEEKKSIFRILEFSSKSVDGAIPPFNQKSFKIRENRFVKQKIKMKTCQLLFSFFQVIRFMLPTYNILRIKFNIKL